jgi:hypothetical protein
MHFIDDNYFLSDFHCLFFYFTFYFLTLIQLLLKEVLGCTVQQLFVNNWLGKEIFLLPQMENSFNDGVLQK